MAPELPTPRASAQRRSGARRRRWAVATSNLSETGVLMSQSVVGTGPVRPSPYPLRRGEGREVDMVKALSFFKRKAGMSVEDFQSYWRTHHPDAVLRMPGIRRYVQSHTLLAGYRKGQPAYDGIAEVWFDDTTAMRAL